MTPHEIARRLKINWLDVRVGILVNRRRQDDHTVFKRRDVAREFPKMVSQVGQVWQHVDYIEDFHH